MYRDNTLIPSETVRLAALGILADGNRHYSDLASEVRHFTAHIVGPSLDLIAPPLELLIVEELVEPVDGHGMTDNALLRITDAGRAELMKLLNSNVRAPVTDVNKLVIALKMRFLHLLTPGQQRLQVEMLVEMCERELTRLQSLRQNHAVVSGHLAGWLDQDIGQTRSRLDWFRELQNRL